MTTQQGAIDFLEMYATHDAFRRDLDRLVAASDDGQTTSPQVRAGWANFKTQLHIHHTVEDADLWPRVRKAVAGRDDDLALVDEMEAEHALLDPVLADVDRAMALQASDLPEQARRLSAALGGHLGHEEERALPLLGSALTQADWRDFGDAMTRAQGLKGAAVYVPWIVDGIPLGDRNRFLAKMPALVRLANRLSWEARYQRRNLWKY